MGQGGSSDCVHPCVPLSVCLAVLLWSVIHMTTRVACCCQNGRCELRALRALVCRSTHESKQSVPCCAVPPPECATVHLGCPLAYRGRRGRSPMAVCASDSMGSPPPSKGCGFLLSFLTVAQQLILGGTPT